MKEPNEDAEEEKRKKAKEILDELAPLMELGAFYGSVELVFRDFLCQKLKDVTQEFYQEMMYNLETEGYAKLKNVFLDCSFQISDKIHDVIWEHQIDDKLYRQMYQTTIDKAIEINPRIPRLDLDEEDDEFED